MKFIFEDYADDILSLLFKKAYQPESADKFIYAEGNGNLEFETKKCLKETEDIIIVYLDTIPCNETVTNIYTKLRDLSIANNYRVIVFNIVCAEYYFIKSIYSSNLFVNREGVDLCVNRDFYLDSTLLKTRKDKKKVKTFEKFCKFIMDNSLIDCARTGNRNNNIYPSYYTKDCLCSNSINDCVEKSLKYKAFSYINQYPCVPSEGFLGRLNKILSLEGLWQVHRSLVNDYNVMVDKFIKAETRRNFVDYTTIIPIK